MIRINARITTHLPTVDGRKAELAWLADPRGSLPTKWSPVIQGRQGQRPTTQPLSYAANVQLIRAAAF